MMMIDHINDDDDYHNDLTDDDDDDDDDGDDDNGHNNGLVDTHILYRSYLHCMLDCAI